MLNSAKSTLRFLSTVRHLRSRQIWGQVRTRLRKVCEHPDAFSSRATPPYAGCRWHPKGEFLPPGPQNNSAADILGGRLTFLNNTQEVGCPPKWDCDSAARLWHYNLHYFEYLWALDYQAARTLALDWIENYPLARRQAGWESYPISLRLLNWCGVFFGKFGKRTESDASFLRDIWGGVCLQAEWLAGHLETHILGNHLFENAVALAVAGSCFSGSIADRWLKTGISILKEEISEQLLSDGMHFELSPMYHCRISYLLAMLFNTGHPQLCDLSRRPLEKACSALSYLVHPDGRIALFNDSAFGIYNEPGQLMSYVKQLLGQNGGAAAVAGSFAFPEAGYFGFRDGEGTYLVFDAASVGPDYIPGHAHADIFSFELSLKGHRVIVDSGVYDYAPGRMRQYCRSTKAHNTVEIAGQDQCDMWAVFRVGRRGHPRDVKWAPGRRGMEISAWHDGYRRLEGGPVHCRRLRWSASGGLAVKDAVIASCEQRAASRLHLHPHCKVAALKNNCAVITYPAGKLKISFEGEGQLAVEDSFYCPEFGMRTPNTSLRFCFSGTKVETGFRIEAV